MFNLKREYFFVFPNTIQIDGQIDSWIDRWIDEYIDRWIDGQMDRWIDI